MHGLPPSGQMPGHCHLKEVVGSVNTVLVEFELGSQVTNTALAILQGDHAGLLAQAMMKACPHAVTFPTWDRKMLEYMQEMVG